MFNLIGKKILFICPEFYTYHIELKQSMERAGAVVDFVSEFPVGSPYRILHKLSPSLNDKFLENHRANIVAKAKIHQYDFLFVIRGGCLNPELLKKLRELQPTCKFLMYQWDSARQSNYIDCIEYFDIVKTFDSEDSERYKIEYLALYYGKSFSEIEQSFTDIDMAFFGAYHSDRLKLIKYFHDTFEKKGLVFFSHLYITKLALLKRVLTGEIKFSEIKFFKTYKASFTHLQKIYARSKSVLDIELSIQSGLSMRTFEVLGANKKLVTTNGNVKKEYFYDENNILVIDRCSPMFDEDFFKLKHSIIECFSQYEIDNWLARMFASVCEYEG